ncbi:MAG: SDR family oxidoreductase [Gammaproteobacteria bacterium]
MKCLVTGGAGFIGSHLARALLHQGHEVKILDNFATGKRENVKDIPVEILEMDVRYTSGVRSAVRGMDYVFHLAALASVSRSIGDPLTTHAVNETGTLTVLDACHKAGVKRVVYAGSSSAYGNSTSLPKREAAKPDPASPYAITKLTGEYYCKVYWETFGLATACVRYFNVFGPQQDPDSEYAAVIPRFIRAAINSENPVIYGDGTQSRDFTYVKNAVAGTILAATSPKSVGEVINIACGERRSLLNVIEMLEDMLGDRIEPVFEAPRLGDVKHSQASIDEARHLLDYVPEVGFKEGLYETLEWFRNRHAMEQYRPQAGHPEKNRGLGITSGHFAD